MVKEVANIKNSGRCVNTDRMKHLYFRNTVFNSFISFLLGFLISGALYHEKCFIGGVALVGASGAGICGFFSLLGVTVGYGIFFGVNQSIHYIAAGLFIYTIAYIFQFLRLYQSPYFMPFIVMVVVSLIRAFGAVNIVRNESAMLSTLVLEMLLSSGLTYLFSFTIRNDLCKCNHLTKAYSHAAILSVIFMALSPLRIAENMIVANILATAAYLLFRYHLSKCTSYSIAILFGLALQHSVVGRNNILLLFFIYSFSDFVIIKTSKTALAIYSIAATGVFSIIFNSQSFPLIQLFETTFGVVLFLLFAKKSQLTNLKKDQYFQEYNEEERFFALSDLMETISFMINDSSDEQIDQPISLDAVFDRAVEQVCGQCDKNTICWKSQLYDMVSVLDETSCHVLARGKLLVSDLPDDFIYHCENYQSLILAVNYEILRAYNQQSFAEKERAFAVLTSRLFHGFSEIFNDTAHNIGTSEINKFKSNEVLCAEIGIASRKKAGESVCGDSIRYFKTEQGILYIILSDGIGTGDYAEQQSSLVVNLLEKALRSLNDPIFSIDLVNTVLQQRDSWCYATVDIAAVDLNSGDASFYKLGAADSYIVSGQGFHIVQGNVSSMGSEDDMNVRKFCHNIMLEPNSIIIMTSDGASIVDQSALCNQIQNHQGDMKSAAKKILLTLCEHDSDDQTIILLSLMNRKKDDSVTV